MSSDSVSTIERFRERFRDEPTKFVTWYVATGFLAILIPGVKFAVGMHKYKSSYYYSYVQAENAEEEHGNSFHDANNCKWWQFGCNSVWINENGEEQQKDREEGNEYYGYHSVPSWISGWGTDIGESKDGVSGNHSATSLKFVYAWQLLMFLGLLAYGALVIFKYRGNLAQSRIAMSSLWLLIFGFGNFSFLSMWMLANGSIYTGGQELEEIGGFYHQFSVLMFTTNFWYVLWSLCFVILVGRRVRNIRQVEQLNIAAEDYVPYTDPADTEKGRKSPA